VDIDGVRLDALAAELDAARSLLDEGKPTQALQLLESLDRRGAKLGDSDEAQTVRARVAVTQSLALVEVTGRLPDALNLLDEAARRISNPEHPALVAIHGQRAYTLYRSGRLEEAAASFDAAVDLAAVATPLDLVNVLMNRANLRMELGELGEAGGDLARVIEVAGEAGIADKVWKAQHNLGYIDFLAGRIPRALELMQDSMRAQTGEIHPISLLDRARVLREAGLHREADSLLEGAARRFGEERAIQDLAETELARAECALLSGDASGALAFARSALEHFTIRHNLRWQRRAELLVLHCERAGLGDDWPPTGSTEFTGLAARAHALAEICAAEGRDDLTDQATMLALEAGLRSGGSPAGLEIALLSTDAVAHRLAKREVTALAAWAGGDPAQALREIKRGVDDLSRFQNRFGSLDLRTATATHGQALARLALDLALETSDPEVVFDAIERPRAASTRLPRLNPPKDDVAAGLLADLRQVEEQIRDLEGESRDNEALPHLRGRAGQLAEDIRGRSWQHSGHTSARASVAVSAEELVTDLPPG
jgi:tetratricopeptide (TPR) repeat protein